MVRRCFKILVSHYTAWQYFKGKYFDIANRMILEFIDNEKLVSGTKETALLYVYVASVRIFTLISPNLFHLILYHLIS